MEILSFYGDAGAGWSASGNAAFGFAYGVSRGAEASDGTIQPLNKEQGLGTPGLQLTAQYTWDNKLCK